MLSYKGHKFIPHQLELTVFLVLQTWWHPQCFAD